MFNFFKKQTATIYKVTYRFIGTEETYTQTATSAGLASLDADWLIEILEVVKALALTGSAGRSPALKSKSETQ